LPHWFFSSFISGCGFLPGFSLLESPTLYYIPVAEFANRVACELQEFMNEHMNDRSYANHRWVLSDDDVKVVLALQTDDQGYVNFTGINAAQIGLNNLQAFIASQSKLSTLGAKLSAKRTKTVAVTFSVSPTTLEKTGIPNANCATIYNETPLTRLYLRDWLNNYFETINESFGNPKVAYQDLSASDFLLHNVLRPLVPPPPVPKQFKIQTVELSTTLVLVADVSAGLNQNVFGNGTTFLVPINGLGVDYNPDYSHKLDITLNICDSTDLTSCNPTIPNIKVLTAQCTQYGLLNPLLPDVKPPKDYTADGKHYRCNRQGKYTAIS
jgi:hypothetical protein